MRGWGSVAAVVALAACSFRAPSSGVIADAPDVDAPPGVTCYGTFVKVCPLTPPSGAIQLPQEIDTSTSDLCTPIAGPNEGRVCAIAGASIDMQTDVRVIGTLALVLVATGSISITKTLDLASHRSPRSAGAGADPPECLDGMRALANGGGFGGSFGGRGGDGGDGSGGTGGTAPAPATITGLRGGCAGSDGGDTASSAGLGGGAVALIALGELAITGVIDASGAGGEGGTQGDRGAGGGGSGGMIVLEAATFAGAGQVFANGGGGGEGGGNGGTGNFGDDPTSATAAAAGGSNSTSDGGNGGDGSLADVGQLGESTGNGGGGGGGGGAGVIRVIGPQGYTGTLSPAPQ
jgi:hypothetical protein